MGGLALALVICSAAIHAGWNTLTKRSHDPLAFLWCMTAASLVVYAVPVAIVVVRHPPPRDGLPFLAATIALHIAYFSLLARAYQQADLSLAYPVARGTALALVPLLSVPLFGDRPTPAAWAGIALIVLGILWLHAPALRALRRRTGLAGVFSGWAFLTGLTITGYSLVDAGGVQRVLPPVYLFILFAGNTIVMAPYVLRRHRPAVRRELRCHRWSVVAAGAGSFGTYLIVLTAFRLAPVAYVVPVRELGVVFGALLGTRLLKEPFGTMRIAACVLVVVGVAAIGAGG